MGGNGRQGKGEGREGKGEGEGGGGMEEVGLDLKSNDLFRYMGCKRKKTDMHL